LFLVVVQAYASGPAITGVGDFDGDGRQDVVWMNTTSRQATVWYLGGTGGVMFRGWNYLAPTGQTGWQIVAAADFDGNGVPDLVWQNDTTGQVTVWYIGGAGGAVLQGWNYLSQSSISGWHVVAAADFDGNGVPDLVWQNDSTRQVTVWYMGGAGGAVFQGWNYLSASGFPGWHVAAAADFNGDGVPDVVWQNDSTRQVLVWYMGGPGGATYEGQAYLDQAGQAGWTVMGANNFSGDGVPDLVWENDTSDQVKVWYMGGTGGATMQNWAWLDSGGEPGWRVVVPSGRVTVAAITVGSTNTVSNSINDPTSVASYRWEPSSAYGGAWISSWHDVGTVRGNPNVNVTHAYTSAWVGNAWSAALEHRTPDYNLPIMDTYTYWDTTRGRHVLAAVEYEPPGRSIWVQYSVDATGTSWSPMVKAMAGSPQQNPPASIMINWDFPSIAVNTNTGRIVVGASDTAYDGSNVGYWASYSDNGVNWSEPCLVNNTSSSPVCMTQSGTQPQGLGGATSRIVWSASGFHAFIQQISGNTDTLQHWQSPDGVTWTRQADIATYGLPNLSSSTNVGSPSGEIYYAANPDAVSSPGLGWVVAYPVNDLGVNAINVSTELGGGVTISYTEDLFNHGITTSGAGDWYMTFQTYRPNTTSYLLENAVYRLPGSSPTYLNNTIQQSIDPSQWWYYSSGLGRCTVTLVCYAAGDWFRPAMSTSTTGSVPLILGSANLNDLFQIFIHDPPQAPNASQIQLTITPFQNGTDLSAEAVITPAILQHIAQGHYKYVMSSMAYARLAALGLVP